MNSQRIKHFYQLPEDLRNKFQLTWSFGTGRKRDLKKEVIEKHDVAALGSELESMVESQFVSLNIASEITHGLTKILAEQYSNLSDSFDAILSTDEDTDWWLITPDSDESVPMLARRIHPKPSGKRRPAKSKILVEDVVVAEMPPPLDITVMPTVDPHIEELIASTERKSDEIAAIYRAERSSQDDSSKGQSILAQTRYDIESETLRSVSKNISDVPLYPITEEQVERGPILGLIDEQEPIVLPSVQPVDILPEAWLSPIVKKTEQPEQIKITRRPVAPPLKITVLKKSRKPIGTKIRDMTKDVVFTLDDYCSDEDIEIGLEMPDIIRNLFDVPVAEDFVSQPREVEFPQEREIIGTRPEQIISSDYPVQPVEEERKRPSPEHIVPRESIADLAGIQTEVVHAAEQYSQDEFETCNFEDLSETTKSLWRRIERDYGFGQHIYLKNLVDTLDRPNVTRVFLSILELYEEGYITVMTNDKFYLLNLIRLI